MVAPLNHGVAWGHPWMAGVGALYPLVKRDEHQRHPRVPSGHLSTMDSDTSTRSSSMPGVPPWRQWGPTATGLSTVGQGATEDVPRPPTLVEEAQHAPRRDAPSWGVAHFHLSDAPGYIFYEEARFGPNVCSVPRGTSGDVLPFSNSISSSSGMSGEVVGSQVFV